MAKLMGLKKITLSPPKKILGSHSFTKEKKSIFKPEANGNNPRIVVMAVKSTGRRRVFHPLLQPL